MFHFKKIGYQPSSKIFTPKLVKKSSEDGLFLKVNVQTNYFKEFEYNCFFSIERSRITKEEHLNIKITSSPFPLVVNKFQFVKGVKGDILTSIPPVRTEQSRSMVLPTKHYLKKYNIPFFYEKENNIIHNPVYLIDENEEISEIIHLYAYITLIKGVDYLVIECETKTRVHIHYPDNDIYGYIYDEKKIELFD